MNYSLRKHIKKKKNNPKTVVRVRVVNSRLPTYVIYKYIIIYSHLRIHYIIHLNCIDFIFSNRIEKKIILYKISQTIYYDKRD